MIGKRGCRKGRSLITHILWGTANELLTLPHCRLMCHIPFDSGSWDVISKWWYLKSMWDVLVYQDFFKAQCYSHQEWQVSVDLTGHNFTISSSPPRWRESTVLTTLVKLVTTYKSYLHPVLNYFYGSPHLAHLHGVRETKSTFFGVSLAILFKTYFIALLPATKWFLVHCCQKLCER